MPEPSPSCRDIPGPSILLIYQLFPSLAGE
jgi:hypothetical protein